MKLASTNRPQLRTAVLIAGCLAAATIAIPGIATAGVKAVQEVVVTNEIEQAIPVTPQGETEVTGKVALDDGRAPVQIRLQGLHVSREDPVATEIVYTVPEGKLLTVEYAEVYFWQLADPRRAYFSVGCDEGAGREGPIHSVPYHLPKVENGIEDHVFAGPLKMHVPAGRCLRSNVAVDNADLEPGASVVVHGAVTGYLTDVPPTE